MKSLLKIMLALVLAAFIVPGLMAGDGNFTGYPDSQQIWIANTELRIRDTGQIGFGDGTRTAPDATFSYNTTNDEVDISKGISVDGGITTSGDVVITSVLTGLDVDVTSAGADASYFGIDNDITQGSVASGAYLSRGNLIGASSTVLSIGNIDHVYPYYGRSALTMADDTESNQLIGGIFLSNVAGAKTLTLHGEVVGIHAGVEVPSTVTDITGGTIAAGFFHANLQKALTTDTYGIYVQQADYCDYGAAVMVEDSNATAAIYIQARGTSVVPIGLKIGTKDTGTITKDVELQNGETLDNATNGILNAVGNVQVKGALNYAGVSASTGKNTYVLDATPDLVTTAPTKGQVVTWCSDTAGDGASTVSVDGVSDTLQDRAGNTTAASDILADGMVIMIFDGTNWRLAGI